MIPITNLLVRQKIQTWQAELREMTGNKCIRLMVTSKSGSMLELQTIASIVSAVTGVPLSMIKHKSRMRQHVTARHLFCYYARSNTKCTLTQIGEFLGGRDHTTVIHSETAIKDLLVTREDTIVNYVASINAAIGEIENVNEEAAIEQ